MFRFLIHSRSLTLTHAQVSGAHSTKYIHTYSISIYIHLNSVHKPCVELKRVYSDAVSRINVFPLVLPAITHTHTLTLAYFPSHSPRSFSRCMQTIRLAWVFMSGVTVKTDRQTHTPTEWERNNSQHREEKNLAIRSLLCGKFHLEYKNVWHSSLNAFSLANGHRREKKNGCYDFNWKRMNWNSIFFSPLADGACESVCMNAKRWAIGEELGIDQD